MPPDLLLVPLRVVDIAYRLAQSVRLGAAGATEAAGRRDTGKSNTGGGVEMRSIMRVVGAFAAVTTFAVASSQAAGASLTLGIGYWEVAADGGVFTYGGAPFYGSMGGRALGAPVVGMASTPDGHGYWEVGSDGGIFSFGDAAFHGSMGGLALNRPVVGMATDPATGGYWEVASDGGVFSFDAPFFGSTGGIRLNRPIVGMAATPDGHGYWLVASDGGVFTYGDAGFFGSPGSLTLNAPIVSLGATPDGHGYWLVASDGGVFTYGDAGFFGSLASFHVPSPIVSMTPSSDGGGYWMVAPDSSASAFGDAQYHSSIECVHPAAPVVGIAARPASGLTTNFAGVLSGRRVAVVGDSMTALSDCQIAETLAGRYAYQVRGDSGFTMAQALPLIHQIQSDPLGAPEDWVIDLGSNDAGVRQTPTWQTDLANEISAVQGSTCVIFVTLPELLSQAGPVAGEINAALAAAVASHPNFHLLDWGRIEFTQRAWVGSDGVHPTALGSVELAFLERQYLDQDCPG
jgi:hypothetical protein